MDRRIRNAGSGCDSIEAADVHTEAPHQHPVTRLSHAPQNPEAHDRLGSGPELCELGALYCRRRLPDAGNRGAAARLCGEGQADQT